MKRIDRCALKNIASSNINKSTIAVYLHTLRVSKKNESDEVYIDNFNRHRLAKIIRRKAPWISERSIYDGADVLIAEGVFVVCENRLIITNTGLGHISDEFYKGEGYIKLHDFFYSFSFYKLSLRAQRLALHLCGRLNNISGKVIKENFKSKKNPEKYSGWCKMLRVNRLCHIEDALEELKKFFNIVKLEHNTYTFSLNRVSECIISDKDASFAFSRENFNKVKEASKGMLNVLDIEEIASATMGVAVSKIRTIVDAVAKRKDSIKSIYAYSRHILSVM